MPDYAHRTRRRRIRSAKIFKANKIVKYTFFGLLGFILLVVILFLWYGRDLPTPEKLTSLNLPQSTRILDRKGIVLYDIYSNQNRSYVPLSKIPKTLQEATIAIEDKDFYKNEGYSITGYVRSLFNILLFKGLSGGSTITQQLVKQTLLTSERTIPRKIKEFILAIEVDKKYSKKQILELYLNVAPYGGPNVGVETAAEGYFGKKASELNLVECAILAGLPQSPSYYSPFSSNPKAYVKRAEAVLRRMREDGYITTKQEQDALKQLPNVKFLARNQTIKAPHFAFYVKDLLVKKFGESMVENGGLQVTTTLDYKLQNKAEDIVREEVNNARTLRVGNGASIVIDPTSGEILSMVGSRDFFATDTTDYNGKKVSFEGMFNVITQGKRQPGSAIKPVMYATALQRGYTAASLIMDTKTVFPDQGGKDYTPVNYDDKYHGPVQVRFALGSSLNVPAVKMLAQVGIKNMLTNAYNMGISTLIPTDENISRFGLSITLGGGDVIPFEFANAFSAFANGGNKVDSVAILKVTDRDGKMLYEHKNTSGKKQVLDSGIAFIISHILLDNNARLLTFGPNSYLNIQGRQIAVKTGTTDDKRDNWTIGWTPNVLVLAWVGNNDNSPMGQIASGVTGAAPIWRRVILEAIKEKPVLDFQKPDNVTALTIDALLGGLPAKDNPTRSEYFIKGTEPQSISPMYIDYDNKLYLKLTEKDPVSTDGQNRWQQGIDQWISDNHKDDPLYHPPEIKKEENKEKEEEPTATPTVETTPTETPIPTVSP